jgi:hypothetical protein
MDAKRYDKKIAELEQSLQDAKTSYTYQVDRLSKAQREKERDREKMLSGLLTFLTELNSKLGAIQAQIMTTMVQVQKLYSEDSQERIKKINEAMSFISLGHTAEADFEELED